MIMLIAEYRRLCMLSGSEGKLADRQSQLEWQRLTHLSTHIGRIIHPFASTLFPLR